MSDVVTIDCGYLDRQQFAAAYLLIDGDQAAFVDNNTNACVPLLLAALERSGLTPEQVDYLILTHVHLDHAGGTTALARACPQAMILAHPRAAPHVIDPAKLVASASAVYGESEFARLYGSIEPLPAARVRTLEDDERLDFGSRRLRFLHTRGHANHHMCILDESANVVFTGDAFGLIYPRLQQYGTLAFPSTSPTDFEPDLARAAIRRLIDLRPAVIYPTHFGAVTDYADAAAQLLRHLDFAEQLRDQAERSELPDDALADFIRPRLRAYFAGLLDASGPLGSAAEIWEFLQLDIDLNIQGIAFAAAKRRRKARQRDA